MEIWDVVLLALGLGVGLAMDAFSVSLANGLNDTGMRPAKMCGVAGVFALFQGLMPLIGWFCVCKVAETFKAFEKFIPWIALVLLLWIGGKMLFDGIRPSDEEGAAPTRLTLASLLIQGVATSIDALSVGFTIPDYTWQMALLCVSVIAVMTFGICMAGLYLGKTFGTRLAGKASILGGVILCGIGIFIFLKGIL